MNRWAASAGFIEVLVEIDNENAFATPAFATEDDLKLLPYGSLGIANWN
ncbi:MAG: hypothetical protein JNK85_12750 [Verrucomicrobiales bacterium]|nr:hypothetical protein [Verrucomicrobiales bacterium]